MPELTLELVERRRYALGNVGTLTSLPRFRAMIEAGGETWRLTRSAGGFGQTINAADPAGQLAAQYVPRGVLRLRGIYGGVLHAEDRSFDWRARRRFSRHFTLSEGDALLAEFEAAVSVKQPVQIRLDDLSRVRPLTLLFCCFISKQVLDTARAGRIAAAEGAVIASGG